MLALERMRRGDLWLPVSSQTENMYSIRKKQGTSEYYCNFIMCKGRFLTASFCMRFLTCQKVVLHNDLLNYVCDANKY